MIEIAVCMLLLSRPLSLCLNGEGEILKLSMIMDSKMLLLEH